MLLRTGSGSPHDLEVSANLSDRLSDGRTFDDSTMGSQCKARICWGRGRTSSLPSAAGTGYQDVVALNLQGDDGVPSEGRPEDKVAMDIGVLHESVQSEYHVCP